LNKVQSVVNQHVINLEIDCNTLLFDRTGRYPTLTEADEKLLPHAQAVIEQHQRLKNLALALTDNTPREITIALDEGISFKVIASIISKLQNEFPNITLEFLSASSPDIIDMLRNEQALTGIVFSELTIPSYLYFECIRSRNTQSSSFQLKVSPNVWYADNYFLLLELALQGNGWSFLPNHIADESVESGQLLKLPLEFEEMGWQANVDVVQHQRHSNLAVFKVLRILLRNLL